MQATICEFASATTNGRGRHRCFCERTWAAGVNRLTKSVHFGNSFNGGVQLWMVAKLGRVAWHWSEVSGRLYVFAHKICELSLPCRLGCNRHVRLFVGGCLRAKPPGFLRKLSPAPGHPLIAKQDA